MPTIADTDDLMETVRTAALRRVRIRAESLGQDLGAILEEAMTLAYAAGMRDGRAERDAERAL